jgi:hypothetical protein
MIPNQPTRRPRRDCRYSAEEMKVLNQHKHTYRSQPTRELRGEIFRNRILVDMFNYWQSKGLEPDEDEVKSRIKVSISQPELEGN